MNERQQNTKSNKSHQILNKKNEKKKYIFNSNLLNNQTMNKFATIEILKIEQVNKRKISKCLFLSTKQTVNYILFFKYKKKVDEISG